MNTASNKSSLTATCAMALCLTVFLAGCKVGPNYHTPEAKAPDHWLVHNADPQADIEQEWWKHFHDPVLDQLIAKARAGNPDLGVAEARIDEARAMRANARDNLLPTVNTDANFERQSNRIAFGNVPFDLAKPFNNFQAGFDASWELDVFGGRRREIESATADLEAAKAARDDARVSLAAEVARTYIDIRLYQAQLAIAQQTIDAETKIAALAEERFKAGEAPGLDVTQAQAQAALAGAQLPYYRNLMLQAAFSLDVLMGEKAGTTQALTDTTAPIPSADKELVLAAPAKVIASRPDICEAERKLASATAQQGVATAQFFPDISLTGFLGLLSSDANSFLERGSKSWDFAGNVVWPILNFGKLEANLHASDARQKEALIQYQKAVIVGINDVERSVNSYTQEQLRSSTLDDVAAKDTGALAVARDRYQQGLSSFIEVLDAERTLNDAQSQASASHAQTSEDLVAVYKSLGGGWQEMKNESKAPDVNVAPTPGGAVSSGKGL